MSQFYILLLILVQLYWEWTKCKRQKTFWGEKKTKNIISHKALKQDIRCTCTESYETKAFKRISLQNEFVSAKFHISIIKAPLFALQIKLEYLKKIYILNTCEEDIRNVKNGKNQSVNTKLSARINFKIGDLNGKSVLMEPSCTR